MTIHHVPVDRLQKVLPTQFSFSPLARGTQKILDTHTSLGTTPVNILVPHEDREKVLGVIDGCQYLRGAEAARAEGPRRLARYAHVPITSKEATDMLVEGTVRSVTLQQVGEKDEDLGPLAKMVEASTGEVELDLGFTYSPTPAAAATTSTAAAAAAQEEHVPTVPMYRPNPAYAGPTPALHRVCESPQVAESGGANAGYVSLDSRQLGSLISRSSELEEAYSILQGQLGLQLIDVTVYGGLPHDEKAHKGGSTSNLPPKTRDGVKKLAMDAEPLAQSLERSACAKRHGGLCDGRVEFGLKLCGLHVQEGDGVLALRDVTYFLEMVTSVLLGDAIETVLVPVAAITQGLRDAAAIYEVDVRSDGHRKKGLIEKERLWSVYMLSQRGHAWGTRRDAALQLVAGRCNAFPYPVYRSRWGLVSRDAQAPAHTARRTRPGDWRGRRGSCCSQRDGG